jgi:hypothetical protein
MVNNKRKLLTDGQKNDYFVIIVNITKIKTNKNISQSVQLFELLFVLGTSFWLSAMGKKASTSAKPCKMSTRDPRSTFAG